jgi:hypothetical protein
VSIAASLLFSFKISKGEWFLSCRMILYLTFKIIVYFRSDVITNPKPTLEGRMAGVSASDSFHTRIKQHRNVDEDDDNNNNNSLLIYMMNSTVRSQLQSQNEYKTTTQANIRTKTNKQEKS